jgi:hypothetical protein
MTRETVQISKDALSAALWFTRAEKEAATLAEDYEALRDWREEEMRLLGAFSLDGALEKIQVEV